MFSFKTKRSTSLVPSKSTLALEEMRAKSKGTIPFFGAPRLSILSDVSSDTYDSDEESMRLRLFRRLETRRQMCKTLSKTRRSLLRLSNWAYEREWRKERKYAPFDPIVVRLGGSDMSEVHCHCSQCPCKHDALE